MKSATAADRRGHGDSQSDQVAALLDRRRSILAAIRLCASGRPTDGPPAIVTAMPVRGGKQAQWVLTI